MEPAAAPNTIIALLGSRDKPTDAIEDYCLQLGAALGGRGWMLELQRVPWAERGWLRALTRLWSESRAWRGRWVLVQYSALQWSRRGWPLGLLAVLGTLQLRVARVAVVFHDPRAFPVRVEAGPARRLLDHLRRACQRLVLRSAYALAERSFFTLDLALVPWLPHKPRKARFLPVGSNVPACEARTDATSEPRPGRVAVFGITGGAAMLHEVETLRVAVTAARANGPVFELAVFGRGAREAEPHLRAALAGSGALLSVEGILSGEEIAERLAGCDAQLFFRGSVSTRRGSAIAGICRGLPVVGYSSKETGSPITEAGVVLVEQGDAPGLGRALARVLNDEGLRRALSERSRRAAREWFAWERIAERLLQALPAPPEEPRNRE